MGKKRDSLDIKDVECRHIFRTGKYKHSDDILNDNWTFRVAAWGKIHVLEDGETCPNEVVIKCLEKDKSWIREALN